MRRKLSKLMAYLLTFCMLMSLMPATAFAIPAPHSHPICGAETCTADHNLDGTAENHQSVTWIAWDGTDMDEGEPGIQLNAGNYYLLKDVNVTSDTKAIHPVGNVALCLNGHTISCESGAAISAAISINKTDDCLTLTDCAGTGLVTRSADDDSVTIWISYGKLEQYGGTIQATSADNQSTAIWNQNYGTFSQYGGTIESESRGIDSLNLSTVNLYGGTIEAAMAGIYASETIVNLYGGNITAQYGLGAFVETNVNLYNAVDIDGTTADIYVGTEGVITLSSEISKPAEPYSIAADFNTPFTSGWNTYMSSATISDYFIPYSSEYIIKKNASTGELVFDVKPTTYTVKFDANGGSGTMADQTIEVGTETALSPNSFTRSGYKFSGWATSADGAKVYDDKQSVTDIAGAGESITLFAVWTEKATITISDVQQQYDYTGEPIEFNLNSPLTGFTVKYRVKDTTTWSDSVPTEVNIYDVKITRAEDADYKAYEMTFFGKLVINKALQAAPTTPAVVNETIKNKADGKITGVTTAMEYKKQGDADYTKISGTEITNLAAGTYLVRYKETETHSASGDKEIVIADGKTISATFDMDGHGTTTDGQSGKAYGDKVSEPAAPTDNDWKFIGWYKENTFVNEWDFANDTLADDTVIYAKWQEKKSVAIYEAAQTYYYDGNEKEFELSGTDAALAGFDIQYKIDGTYGSAKPTEFGSYDVKITRAYDGEYKAYSKEIIGGLVIAQSGTEFADKQILKDGTPTTTFTYGDTITVKIKPQATGQAAPMMLMSLSAPAKNQMALFYNNGTEDIQISDAAEADSDGYYTMTVNTTENLVMPTNATVSLIAKYVGNNNMADYSETLEITFNKADSSVTAPAPVENLVYNGSEQTLISAATDVVGGTVKYKLEGGEYSTELPQTTNAGTYTVYYKVVGDNNHNDVTEQSFTVTIAEKVVSPVVVLTAPTPNQTPQTSIETEEYTATVTWNPVVTDKFAYSTAYTATITLTPKANYTVTGITENGYTVSGAESITNTADSGDITVVYAETGRRPSSGGGTTRYTVKFDTDGGSKVSNKTVTRNSTLAEPTEPTKDGYTFIGWFTDEELTKAYDFETKVTKNITLYAKWEKVEDDKQDENEGTTGKDECNGSRADNCPAVDFTDVDIAAWYHLNIDYVLENGLMKGTATDKFAPNDNLTRAMLVTILYRAEGEPGANRSIPFSDVDMGAYYANAVIWAKQNGIVNGVSETEFAPNDNITREQIAAILYRYAQYKGMDAVNLSENLGFADADEISEYAISAMNWAVGTGLMNGKSATTINPKDNATRAEIAAILHRFIEANK